MSIKNSDQLFQLIKTLTKGEKRHFKLVVTRHKGGENAKFLKLFDLIDSMPNYNEEKILDKEKSISPAQLPNLKQHLYKQVMQSLRMLHASNDIDLKIREQIDYASILYNKCLYQQSAKVLEKAKEMAKKFGKTVLLLDIHEIEKKLVTKFVRRNIQNRVEELIPEGERLQSQLNNINTFSNLSMKIYAFYLRIGFIRNSKDFELANSFLYSTLPVFQEALLSTEEKIHLFDSLVGYYFFTQDYNRGYDYAKKWVALFDENPSLIISKLEMYIKGVNSLLKSQSKLSLFNDFLDTNRKFEEVKTLPDIFIPDNVSIQLFKYSSKHKIECYFMLGEFDKGALEVDKIAIDLEYFKEKLNQYDLLLFYYKFACMYFGNDQYKEAVHYLNEIINTKDVDLRADILSFARILNLISHYELKNNDLVDYYVKSTYRFLSKKEDLHLFQTRIIRFLKKLNVVRTDKELRTAFKDLRDQLAPLTGNPYEKRAFMYFDIISWLESKIYNKPVQEIIQSKVLKRAVDQNSKQYE